MLVGSVQFDVQTKMWRLQYLEAEKTDSMGGTVSLVGLNPEESALRSGMIVAARGSFANANSQEPIRDYRLQEIRIIAE